MLKNIVKLEHKVGDRVYQLLCDNDSPLQEVKDAIFQFSGFVAGVEKQAQEAAAKKSAEESPPAESSKIEEING